MDNATTKNLIGELKWTKEKILQNVDNECWGEEEDHYPQCFEASTLNLAAVRKMKQQSSTFADCVLIPDSYTTATLAMLEGVQRIHWLCGEENSKDNLLDFVNRTREKHGLMLLLPVLDRAEYEQNCYDKHLNVVYYVLANRYEAVIVKPEESSMDNVMKYVLQSKEIVKVILNHDYDLEDLFLYYSVKIQALFSIARATEVVLNRLGIVCETNDNNPMPSLSRITGIPIPLVAEKKYRNETMLRFMESLYWILEFLVRFKQHPDNILVLRRFGMDWHRDCAIKTLTKVLPASFGNEKFWYDVMATKNTCVRYPYFVAAWLYCTSPYLLCVEKNSDVYDEQDAKQVPKIYRELMSLSGKKEKCIVDKDCGCSRCMKGALVNWIKFKEDVSDCAQKYPRFGAFFKLLMFYAPSYCRYVQYCAGN